MVQSFVRLTATSSCITLDQVGDLNVVTTPAIPHVSSPNEGEDASWFCTVTAWSYCLVAGVDCQSHMHACAGEDVAAEELVDKFVPRDSFVQEATDLLEGATGVQQEMEQSMRSGYTASAVSIA